MRVHARTWILSLICGVLVASALPAAAKAQIIGIGKFVATNCEVETCGQEEVARRIWAVEIQLLRAEAEARLNKPKKEGLHGSRRPGALRRDRLRPCERGRITRKGADSRHDGHQHHDVAPGLAANPFAVETCSIAEFGGGPLASIRLFEAPGEECEESEIGTQEARRSRRNSAKAAPATCRCQARLRPRAGRGRTHGQWGRRSRCYRSSGKQTPQIPHRRRSSRKPLPKKNSPYGEPTEKVLIEKQWYSRSLIKGSVKWGTEQHEGQTPATRTTTSKSKRPPRRRCCARAWSLKAPGGDGETSRTRPVARAT